MNWIWNRKVNHGFHKTTRQRKGQRILALGLCICILASLAGCGQGKDEGTKSAGKGEGSSQNNTADNTGGGGSGAGTGAYRETALTLPVEDSSQIVSMLKNSSQELEIYAAAGGGQVNASVSADGQSWQEQNADWIQLADGEELVKVIMGEDQIRYAMVFKDQYMRIIKEENGGVEVNLPALKELADNKKIYSFNSDLRVLSDGSIVVEGWDTIYIYNQEDGSLIKEFQMPMRDTDSTIPMDAKGDKVVYVNEEGSGFALQKMGGEKEEQSYAYENSIQAGSVMLAEDDSLFVVDNKGISHLQSDGDLMEVIIGGTDFMMGNPTYFVRGALRLGDQEFVVLYETANGEKAVYRYHFDDDLQAGSGQALTIYGLEESGTVRYAINVFRQAHPEVTVDYQNGSSSDASASKADYIRALNTELLNKGGADVLILDGLPVQSFMEKGVLADLSGILEPYISEGALNKNFTDAYTMDGKIYGVPVRYGIPILMGTQENMNRAKSLEELSKWLSENPDQTWYSFGDFSRFLKSLLYVNYDAVVKEDGTMDAKTLAQCLTLAKDMASREGIMPMLDVSELSAEERMEYYDSPWDSGSAVHFEKGDSQAAVMELYSLMIMMQPFTILRDGSYSYEIVNNSYTPHCVAGINSNAKETELAAEFLEILLSEEVQGQDLSDGFPSNQKANEKFTSAAPADMEEAMEGALMGVFGDDGEEITYTLPFKSEVDELLSNAASLDTPVVIDDTVMEMIMNEAGLYEDGSETAEEAAEKVAQKIKTYLSE